jgi:hypothetical protein
MLRPGWPRRNRPLAREASPAVVGPIAFSLLFPGAAEVPVQRPARALVCPDPPIDRLVTDPQLPLAPEPAGDLFRAPVLAQEGLHLVPVPRREAAIAAGAGPPGPRVGVGDLGPIAPVVGGAIAAQLATDGAPVASQHLGDGRPRQPLLSQDGDGVPFSSGDLAVAHGRLPSLGGD